METSDGMSAEMALELAERKLNFVIQLDSLENRFFDALEHDAQRAWKIMVEARSDLGNLFHSVQDHPAIYARFRGIVHRMRDTIGPDTETHKNLGQLIRNI